MGLDRHDECQWKSLSGGNMGGRAGLWRILDDVHSAEAKGLGVRRPVH